MMIGTSKQNKIINYSKILAQVSASFFREFNFLEFIDIETSSYETQYRAEKIRDTNKELQNTC